MSCSPWVSETELLNGLGLLVFISPGLDFHVGSGHRTMPMFACEGTVCAVLCVLEEGASEVCGNTCTGTYTSRRQNSRS